MAGYEHALTLR